MLRMLFIGVLLISVLSACGNRVTLMPGPDDSPVSLSTDKPIPFTATPEPPSTTVPRSEQPEGVEYATVAEALADLKTRAGVSIQVLQGWTIVAEADGSTNWSFAPPDHPAFPAVARRILYRDQDGWHLQMNVLCEAETAACDQFVMYFETLNQPIYQMIAQQQRP